MLNAFSLVMMCPIFSLTSADFVEKVNLYFELLGSPLRAGFEILL